MPNEYIFTNEFLPVMLGQSTAVYKGFSSAPTNQVIWAPQAGKRIFLTGIEISSTLPLVVTTVSLLRGTATFLVARFSTTSPAPFVQSFCSPVVFNVNESIAVTSSLTTVDVTLFGYEN